MNRYVNHLSHQILAVYGRSLNFYSWKEKKLLQSINLGNDGITPLEIRFLHEPTASEGYVGCACSSTIIHFFKGDDGMWKTEKVISVPPKTIDGWMSKDLTGTISWD